MARSGSSPFNHSFEGAKEKQRGCIFSTAGPKRSCSSMSGGGPFTYVLNIEPLSPILRGSKGRNPFPPPVSIPRAHKTRRQLTVTIVGWNRWPPLPRNTFPLWCSEPTLTWVSQQGIGSQPQRGAKDEPTRDPCGSHSPPDWSASAELQSLGQNALQLKPQRCALPPGALWISSSAISGRKSQLAAVSFPIRRRAYVIGKINSSVGCIALLDFIFNEQEWEERSTRLTERAAGQWWSVVCTDIAAGSPNSLMETNFESSQLVSWRPQCVSC